MPKTDNLYRRKHPKTGELTGPWWVKINIPGGKPVYESTKTENYQEACQYRDKLIAQKSQGRLAPGSPTTITIGKILDLFIQAGGAKGKTDEDTLKVYGWVIEKSLRPYFGRMQARKLTTPHTADYRKSRKAEGVEDSTVNREISILRASLRWASRQTPALVASVPYIPLVKETNVRQGLLDEAGYSSLLKELPFHLRTLFIVAYTVGARMGELLEVRWEWVEWDAERILLPREVTKNGKARVLPFLTPEMTEALREAKAYRDSHWPSSPWVFSNHGEPIKSFYRAWVSACERAGVEGWDGEKFHFHDLRRTAVTNLRRAGVPQVVRMKISGHLTDSMERRYTIVDDGDFEDAKEKLAVLRAKSPV